MAGTNRVKTSRSAARGRRRAAWALALLIPAASCVPEAARLQSAGSLAAVTLALPPALPFAAPPSDQGLAAPVAATSLDFRPATALDGARALECLAEAVYYEARSETEAGQRAVAQVVLNRVRHPAWPNSVCAVVYQGPMKPGGGCQFTFTCDGSLARRPVEPGWSAARRVAAEALAGRVFAPVGHATYYHSFSVAPDWAPALHRTAVIGAHIFYRRTGAAGAPAAFVDPYSGREAGPRIAARYIQPQPAVAAPVLALAAPPGPPLDASAVLLPAFDRLPESRVRPEYQNSGAWLTEPR